MGKERKSKVLTYKHTVFHEAGPSLRHALAEALAKLETIGARRESLAPADESPIWRLIGEFQIEPDFVFGVLMRYAPGTNPVFLVDDALAVKLTVQQMSPPSTDDGKRRELVEAMLFFGAMDNHLVMMQSSALRSDHLEKHLQWLLHTAKSLDGTNSLQLIDQPPKTVREKLAKAEVRELSIGGALTPAAETTDEGEEPKDQPETLKTSLGVARREVESEFLGSGGEGVVDALKRLLAPDQAARLDFDQMAGANIEYSLKVRYRNSTTEDGQRMMNTLGSALRHAEGVDTTIKLRGGGEIKGEQLRLSGTVRIDTYNGVPAPSEVFETIRTWLLEKLKSGDVEASLTS